MLTTFRAQRIVLYSFNPRELAVLLASPEFRTTLPTIQTMEEAENLTRSGNRLLLEAQGVRKAPERRP